MNDKECIKLLDCLEREHVASAYAIFADGEAAHKFEMYCLKHGYSTSSYSMPVEDSKPITKVVYWKKD